ncbi:MAG TPA: ABC transporter permease, partial [Planctomycetota bacterium]|nr:ABC transporter permease [Planctomycetota bacterium]
MISIGMRNMKHDPLRMAIAVSGVVFAVVLVTLELGLLFGLVQNASLLIDQSHADIWVMTVNVKTLDFGTPLSQRNKYRLESVPGVERVEEYNVTYSSWQLPEGGNANIQVVGFETNSQLAPMPNIVEGSLAALHNSDGLLVDVAERKKLGNVRINDTVELLGSAGKVVGYTEGMRSFTTTPYVFTSLRRGEKYGWLNSASGEPTSIYFLVRVAPGADPHQVCRSIEKQISGVEALTKQEFSWRTRSYWLVETGMGMGFVIAASLGLLV